MCLTFVYVLAVPDENVLMSVQKSPGEEITHRLLDQHNVGYARLRNCAPDLLQAQIANLNLLGDQPVIDALEPPNQLD